MIKTLRNGWLEVPFCTHVTKCISLLLTGFYKNKRGIYIAVKNHKAINNCNLKIGCIFLQHLTFHTLVTGFRISIAPNSFVNVCNSAIKWCNSIISFINFIIFLFVTSCFLCRRTIALSLKRIFDSPFPFWARLRRSFSCFFTFRLQFRCNPCIIKSSKSISILSGRLLPFPIEDWFRKLHIS